MSKFGKLAKSRNPKYNTCDGHGGSSIIDNFYIHELPVEMRTIVMEVGKKSK